MRSKSPLTESESAYCEAQETARPGIHRLPSVPYFCSAPKVDVATEVEIMFAQYSGSHVEASELAAMTVAPRGRALNHAAIERRQFSVSNAENDEQDDDSVDLVDMCTEQTNF